MDGDQIPTWKGESQAVLEEAGVSIRDSARFHVVIPEGVTKVESIAFYDCRGLTSVAISDGVTEIGYCAFRDCRGLTSVTIPNGVTAIRRAAFRNCSRLTSMTIPDGVTEIGSSAFYDCRGLTSVPQLELPRLATAPSAIAVASPR